MPLDEPFTLPHFGEWARTLILDTGEPWELEDFQAAFIEDLFTGIPELWLVIPEGNTKTTTIAGIGLYHCQHKYAASVPIAASSRDQAEIMFRQAEGFVLRTPHLQSVFRCQEGYRRIRCDEMQSRIQVYAADDRTGDGVIPTLCLLDELHRHRDLRLYRTWRGKLEKRNAQMVAISTAGEPGGEFEEARTRMRTTAPDIRREETFVRAASSEAILHDWAVPEDGDVADMELVKRANPFSGVTVEALRRKFESPTMTIAHWRRFVCNLPTRSELAAIQEAEWFAAQVDEEIPEGVPVWLGLDVAWKWDTTAAVPLWYRDPEFRLLGSAKVLVPPRDGTSLDPHLVESALVEIHKRNPVHTVVMDMSLAEQLAAWIESELGAEVIDAGQSNAAAARDYTKFMEALRNGWLKHTGDRALTEHVLNAIARVLPYGDARFDRPDRSRSGPGQTRRVIDALTAAASVHTVASSGDDTEPWAEVW